MKAAALVGILVIATSFSANAQVGEELYGTWRLVSFTWQVVGTGKSSDLFGKAPHGFINYGRDGRMFAIIVSENRPKPTDLAKMTTRNGPNCSRPSLPTPEHSKLRAAELCTTSTYRGTRTGPGLLRSATFKSMDAG